MFYQRARQLFKYTLILPRIKLVYSRVTLTRFTAAYFLLSLAACLGLVSLQGHIWSDNTQAIRFLGTVFAKTQNVTGLTIVSDGILRVCSDIPDNLSNCTAIASFCGGMPLSGGGTTGLQRRELIDADFLFPRSIEEKVTKKEIYLNELTDSCVTSLRWLDDGLHDAQREDVVSLFFRVWLFMLSTVAVLNESIPHLVAAFLGQVLGTAWAVYCMRSTVVLQDQYRNQIVSSICEGVDLMGNWWESRISHAVSVIVLNVIALLGATYISYKLYQVYSNQSFCRVGASEKVYRIYKIVLLFSVCIQLSVFFSIASAAMWIDEVSHGLLRTLANHVKFYLSIFITDLILHVPWFYIGWICVRKECKWRLGVFSLISVYFTTTSTLVFGSRIYRYIFSTWPFFATITITSYCLVIASVILAIICQFNFGQGLKQYLLVTEALEGVDFTPVSMPVAEKGGLQPKDSKTNEFPAFPVRALQPKHRRGISVPAYSTTDGRPVATSFDSFFPIKAVDSSVRIYNSSSRRPAYADKTSYTSFTSAGVTLKSGMRDRYATNTSRRDLHLHKPLPEDPSIGDNVPRRSGDNSSERISSSSTASRPSMKRLLASPGLPSSPRARLLKNEI